MRSGKGLTQPLAVGALVFILTLGGGVAVADTSCNECSNTQDGDNSGEAGGAGASASGDVDGGQITGVVSAGNATVDAKNRSQDATLESGEAAGSNSSAAFVGQLNGRGGGGGGQEADVLQAGGDAVNAQDGDNELVLTQTSDASSGDAVGGQIIGVVTSAGGSADVVADNASKDVDVETGAADASNENATFVGLALDDGPIEIGPGVAADVSNVSGNDVNVQDGDNSQNISQSAEAATGDGVAGQVLGIVSAGDASLDARNRSEDIALETGSATASNAAAAIVGLSQTTSDENIDVAISDISDVEIGEGNIQEGDNEQTLDQVADASSGDAIGGQVAGIVTSAGGSADVVADNASRKVDVQTGIADAANTSDTITGLANSRGDIQVGLEDIDDITVNGNIVNIQEGDNSQDVAQTSDAASGDGVGGQVLGIVSAGATSLDARNRSEDVDLATGEASAGNVTAGFAGLGIVEGGGNELEVGAEDLSDINLADDANVQEGDNEQALDQAAAASSGDAVGGQVAGIVTSAGGTADVVADNASKDVDVETGAAEASNESGAFTGLALAQEVIEVGSADISSVTGETLNVQEGDNELAIDQSATASTGDGVGGQVLGVVSAGDTSLDARNRSEDVELTTGEAEAASDSAAFTGLALAELGQGDVIVGADIDGVASRRELNVQEGDNTESISQAADASSGDAVGGQVAGIVTSAGGSSDVVADNASKEIAIETGDASASNTSSSFVGLALPDSDLLVGTEDVTDISAVQANVQEGDNEHELTQTSDASSGDGVGGQVLGVVSAGDTSLDARNRSESVELATGDAEAETASASVVGLAFLSNNIEVGTDEVEVDSIDGNVQSGDNSAIQDQSAEASSGDAVAGQVAGVVTSAGGSADAVLDNASKDTDLTSGDVEFSASGSLFVGLSLAQGGVLVGP